MIPLISSNYVSQEKVKDDCEETEFFVTSNSYSISARGTLALFSFFPGHNVRTQSYIYKQIHTIS